MYDNKHLYIIIAISLFLIFPSLPHTLFMSIFKPIITMIFYAMLSTLAINTGLQYLYYGLTFRHAFITATRYTFELYFQIFSNIMGFIYNKMFTRR